MLSTVRVLVAFLAVPFVSALPSADPTDLAARAPKAPKFWKGHDLSSIKMLEDGGAIFKDTARKNRTRPVEDILGDGGMNGVRLRLWVDPPEGTYNLEYTIALAQRFMKKGYPLYLDFHFSDTWADPQKQYIPAAWPTELKPLSATIRKYVADTLGAFAAAQVAPTLVSLGNEIRHGMLWPVGQVNVDVPTRDLTGNFSNLAVLWAAARDGVRDAVRAGVPEPEVMIHLDNGWNATFHQRWYDGLLGSGKVTQRDFDLLGFSFYPFYDPAATFARLRDALNRIVRRFGKPVHIAETDYPALCNGTWNPIPPLSEPTLPVSAEGQNIWVHEVIDIVKDVPNNLGQGVWYWEPAWTNNTSLGSACEDAILFDTDWSQWPNTTSYSRSSVNMYHK